MVVSRSYSVTALYVSHRSHLTLFICLFLFICRPLSQVEGRRRWSAQRRRTEERERALEGRKTQCEVAAAAANARWELLPDADNSVCPCRRRPLASAPQLSATARLARSQHATQARALGAQLQDAEAKNAALLRKLGAVVRAACERGSLPPGFCRTTALLGARRKVIPSIRHI